MNLPLLVDATSIFDFQLYLKEHDFSVQGNPDYAALLDALNREFPDDDFDPKIAFVAISFDHEGQKKFVGFLQRLGFIVDPTDYRDAFILPDRASPYQRLSTRITYVAGMLSHKRPHIVVVTDAFDVYYPLLDLVKNRNCQVTLAFFRSRLENRWQRVGLFDKDKEPGTIQFLDLEPYAKTIIGADLVSSAGGALGKTGLGSLKI
jgi:hypothetical protein